MWNLLALEFQLQTALSRERKEAAKFQIFRGLKLTQSRSRDIFFAYAHMPICPYGHIWAYGHMGIWAYAKKIWPSGVSPKRASKMQLRDVEIRSVGPSVQKLWPTTFFARKMPCILHCNAKKIRNTFSRLVRDLAQKAKLWRSIIQALPTISINLCTSVYI